MARRGERGSVAGAADDGLSLPLVVGVCEPKERDIRVFGDGFDGVTGVLAEESPLLGALHTLGCYLREDCEAALQPSALVVGRRGGELLRITTDD